MIPVDSLIAYYEERLRENPPITSLKWDEVCLDTLCYLRAYKQVKRGLHKLAADPDVQQAEAGE
jgi:hypothetical protein